MKKLIKSSSIVILVLALLCYPTLICVEARPPCDNKSDKRKDIGCSSNHIPSTDTGPPGNIETSGDSDSNSIDSEKKPNFDGSYYNTLLEKALDPPIYVILKAIDYRFPKKNEHLIKKIRIKKVKNKHSKHKLKKKRRKARKR